MRYSKKSSLAIFVLVTLLFLISCTAKPNTTEQPLILTNTPTQQISPTPTEVIIEATPTYIPTLNPDSAYKELENIFAENSCELPCWWGIEPGVTLVSEADNRLNRYYQLTRSEVIRDAARLVLNISLLPEKSKEIYAIYVEQFILRDYEFAYEEQIYSSLLGTYSLQSILKTYGHPSDIFATVEIYNSEPTAPDFMMIWLLYPEDGIIVKYTANAELNNEVVKGCPTKSFFTFWLFPQGDDESYQKLEQLRIPFVNYLFPTLSPRTKPISEAFGISNDEFYQTFVKPTDTCLETPYNIWPEW